MWEWAGIVPTNTRSETDPTKLVQFQENTWKEVASHLSEEPAGTVAVIGVDWFPLYINGELIEGGHWFNAHVTSNGLHWVDAQDGTYSTWPPNYPILARSIEYIFRRPNDSEWRSS